MEDRISERTKKLFLIFKKAVDEERAAQAMYKEAKELCDDDSLKKIFAYLYKDEVRHENELIKRYNQLRMKYNFDE